MIVDAAVVRSRDGAQLRAAAFDRVSLDHLGAVMAQAVLQGDAGDCRREAAQVAGRGADESCQLAEAPVGRGDRLGLARQHEVKAFGIVAGRLDSEVTGFERAGARPVGTGLHGAMEVRQRQEAFVGGTGEPFRRYAAVARTAPGVDAVAGGGWVTRGGGRGQDLLHGETPRRAAGEPLSPASCSSRLPFRSLPLMAPPAPASPQREYCEVRPHSGLEFRSPSKFIRLSTCPVKLGAYQRRETGLCDGTFVAR